MVAGLSERHAILPHGPAFAEGLQHASTKLDQSLRPLNYMGPMSQYHGS